MSRLESFNPYGLDISEAKKSNIMITGLTGSGKTRLAWAHADKLMKNGFQVLVVDPIGVWRDSPLPYFVKVTPLSRINLQLITTGKSIVYDISQLLIGKQLEFLDRLSQLLFKTRVDKWNQKQVMLVIEEVSTFIKNLRGETAQNVYRLAMTGRNYGVRLTYLDPRLNSVPAEFRFLAGQQFHGYANEVNILNKVKRLYGKEWEQVMKTLNVGEFIRVQATHEPTKIQVPLYHSPTRPEPYKPPEPAKKPHQHKFVVNYQPGTRERIQVPKQPGVITVNPPQSTQSNQLLNLLAGFLFTICTYTVIHQFIIRHLI